jgi:hypothetical protein
VVAGGELLGGHGVVDPLLDLLAHPLGDGVVGFPVLQDVVVVTQPQAEAAAVIPLLKHALALLRRVLLGFFSDRLVVVAREVVADPLPYLVVVLLVPPLVLGVERMVAERERIVGGALEDGEVIRLPGELRGDLYAGRAGTDEPDALAGEVDASWGHSAV